MKIGKALALAVVTSLAAQTIDIIAHLATNVTIHIPYISVKAFVIAFTLFLFNYWVGVDWKAGIFSCLTASLMFYVYYRFTEPTLDRTIFTLDEQIKWAAFHFVAIYIPYLLTLKFFEKEAPSVRPLKQFFIILGAGIMIGGLFLFPTKKFLKENNLLLGLSYNDHVMVGTLAFITAITAAYQAISIKAKQ